MQYLSDGTWLHGSKVEADARRLVIAELGGTWTETRVDGAAIVADAMVTAWNNGDLTDREAEAFLRFVAGSGPKPGWLS